MFWRRNYWNQWHTAKGTEMSDKKHCIIFLKHKEQFLSACIIIVLVVGKRYVSLIAYAIVAICKSFKVLEICLKGPTRRIFMKYPKFDQFSILRPVNTFNSNLHQELWLGHFIKWGKKNFSQALKMTTKAEVKTDVLTVSLSDVAGAIVYHFGIFCLHDIT